MKTTVKRLTNIFILAILGSLIGSMLVDNVYSIIANAETLKVLKQEAIDYRKYIATNEKLIESIEINNRLLEGLEN